jgi:hypothetical protein
MSHHAPSLLGRCLAIALALAGATGHAQQALLRDDFEGQETRWRDAGGDAIYRIDSHVRVRGGARDGDWCEQLRVTAGNGTSVYVAYDLGPAPVIEELRPSLWIRSDRPGLQLLARVILPRSRDPASGEPLTLLVRGGTYTQVGAWQQLRLDDLPRLVERQARVARSRNEVKIDASEAFVDRLLVNVDGGEGATLVWIDDLEMPGAVTAGNPAAADVRAAGWNTPPVGRIELSGSLLMIDGRPFFPRMVEHRGEPLEFLRELGFNSVKLSHVADEQILEEAARLGMWLVCPPPVAPPSEGARGPSAPIGEDFDWVLAWDLGDGLSGRDLDWAQSWAERIRRADRRVARPLICGPESDLRAFSRYIDILHVSRAPLGTSLELTDYGTWIRERPRLARPGTPVWTTVQTSLPLALREQLGLLASPGRGDFIESEPVRLLVQTALSAGVRSICFESQSRLDDTTDPLAVRRARTLELLNLELSLIEPWAAAGKLLATLPGSDREVRGALLQTDRCRLLLPIWSGRQAQFVPGQSAGGDVSFVVPTPESYKAYEITPCDLRALRLTRVTGGMKVQLGEFGLTSSVLLTQDPLIQNSLNSRIAKIARRAAELQRELAAVKLADVTTIGDRLAGTPPGSPHLASWLAATRTSMEQCERAFSAGDLAGAYLHASRAMRPLRMVQRAQWESAVSRFPPPVASPFTSCFATLVDQWSFGARLSSATLSPNQLAGGDCERLEQMLDSGWRHFQHAQRDILTAAELSPVSPHSGALSLRLTAATSDAEGPMGLVETPPLWITTAGVGVQRGARFRIHGWVRVPKPIVGTVDGLMIFDSLTGEALAERVGQTGGWQEFTLYRAAPRSGELTVTFALTGLGEAWIDDVTICQLNLLDAPPDVADGGIGSVPAESDEPEPAARSALVPWRTAPWRRK